MTQFALSQATQAAINIALSDGPGTSNVNYAAAYNAIYGDITKNGGVNAATQYWFSQAANVNGQASKATAAGTYIWAYTEAAALDEGYTVTTTNLQAASDAIAFQVFSDLKSDKFVFSDANTTGGFSPQQIIKDDAGAGIASLKSHYPNLDYAVWGGTLFATTKLGDPTYLSDYGINLLPLSTDSSAITDGFLAGAWAAETNFPSSIVDTLSIDGETLASAISSATLPLAVIKASTLTVKFLLSGTSPDKLSSVSSDTSYIYDPENGSAFTLQGSNGSDGGDAVAYNPANHTSQITNFVAASGITIPAGSHVTGYANGTATDTTPSISGSNGIVASVPVTVTNYGAIGATSGYALWLSNNSTVTNGSASDTKASITGGSGGILFQGQQGPSSVSNYGVISGSGAGISDTGTGSLNVNNYGTVNGGIGDSGGTILNLGSISGFNGLSIGGTSTITNGSSTDTTASITGSNLAIVAGSSTLANFGKITGNLQLTGTVRNGSEAVRTASIAGLINATGVTALTNFGAVTGGVSMVAAGGNTVTNGSSSDTTALISGTAGITTAGGPASTINNFGSITGTYLEGIRAGGTANITNGSASDTKALIQGGLEGWGVALNAGSVANYGTVKGGLGCVSLGSGTITNAGVLASATPTGTAIQFGSGANKLIEKAGATISGMIFGGGGSLELANDGTPVTMTSNISVGTLIVDPGTTWSVTTHASVPNIVNNGTVAIASGGSLDVSSAVDPSSTGIFQLMTKGSLELGAILGSALNIQFLGSSPTNELTIDNASKFGTNVGKASYAGPLLENFAAGDVVDIRGIGSTGWALNYSAVSGDLQITGASGAALATLAFQNSTLGAGTFHAAADPFGGALITHS